MNYKYYLLMAQQQPSGQFNEPQQSISPEQSHHEKASKGQNSKDSKSLLHGVNYSFSQQHFQALQAEKHKHQVPKQEKQQQQNRPPPGPSVHQHDKGLPNVASPVLQQQETPYLGQGKKSMSAVLTNDQMNAAASQSSNVENHFSKDRNSISMASVQNAIETSGIQNSFTEALQENTRQKQLQPKKSPGQTSSKANNLDKGMADLEPPFQRTILPEMKTQQNFLTNEVKLLPKNQPDVVSQKNPTLPPTSYRPSGRVTSIERQEQIQQEMMAKGFRPASKENQFEYESDSIEKYEMISNEFDYETIRQSDTFGIKQYRDCIYRGQLDDISRQREGCGVLVYKTGRIYEGQWQANVRHGRGYEVFANGNTYQGNYEKGKANGKGIYSWKNGEVYDGEWKQGVKSGYGVWKGTNGESYIGQWQDSKAQGYGVHVWGNGDKYEGEWEGCLRSGNGSDFFTNGDVFVGQYVNGKPEGFGQYKWVNGSSYTGQFSNGLKHGHGKWKKKQADEYGNTKCNSYDGQYINDKKHGHGTFEWESGNIYVGNYCEDERQGYGVMRWTDGSTYMGTWDQGIQQGIGVMIFPDGSRRAGLFEQNVFKASVKSREQIEPFRNTLDVECFQELEKIIAMREREMKERDDKSRQERSGSWERALEDSHNTGSRHIMMSDGLKKSKESKGTQKDAQSPSTIFDDSVSQISKINRKIQTNEKEDKASPMQKGAPMRKKGMQQQMPSEAEIKSDVKTVLKRYGGTGAPLPQSLALNKRGPPVNQFLQRHMPDNLPRDVPKEVPSPKQKSSKSNTQSQFRASKPSMQESSAGKLKIKHGQFDLGKTTGTMAVQTDLNMTSMSQLEKGNNTQPLRQPLGQIPSQRPSVHTQASPPTHIHRVSPAQNRGWGGYDPTKQYSNLAKPPYYNQREADLEAERLAQFNFAHPQPEMIGQNSFAYQLPNSQFLDTKINENIMMSGPPNAESDSDFNRNSSMMVRSKNDQSQRKRRTKLTGQDGKSKRGTQQEKAFGQGNIYDNLSQPRNASQPSDFNTLTDPRNLNSYSPIIASGSATAYMNHQPSAIPAHPHLSPLQPVKRNTSLNDRLSGPLDRQYDPPNAYPGQRQIDFQQPRINNQAQNFQQPAQNFLSHGVPKASKRKSRQNFMSQISTNERKKKQKFNQTQSITSSIASGPQGSLPSVAAEPPAQYYLPEIAHVPHQQKTHAQNTPVQNPNLHAFHDGANRFQYDALRHDNAWPSRSQQIEEVLTPSPQEKSLQSHSQNQSFQNAFNRSMAQSSIKGNVNRFGQGKDSAARNSQVDSRHPAAHYGTDAVSQVEHDPSRRQSSLHRGKSCTSSQRTLRYNDFELVQKEAQDKEEYQVHLDVDDNDDKHSSQERIRDKEAGHGSSQHRDIPRSRQQNFTKHKPQFLVSSQDSLVNQRNSGPHRREKERMNNSNDTQLASHTHAMQYAGLGSMEDSSSPHDFKRIQRSVPVQFPKEAGKIRVNQNIVLHPDDFRNRKVIPSKHSQSPPARFSEKPPRRGKVIKVDNSGSRKRIIDMRGPYAQNLTKPKLHEVRGLQKIALKNQLQQNWQKPQGYNSENLAANKLYYGQGSSSGGVGYSDGNAGDGGGRFGSLGPIGTQNYVIQHAMMPGSGKVPHSLDNQHFNAQRKRVWVPSNTKRNLKQLQMGMNSGSSGVVFGAGAGPQRRSP